MKDTIILYLETLQGIYPVEIPDTNGEIEIILCLN